MANDLHCPIPTCPGPSDTEDDNWIFCEQCTSWFHSKCVGVVVIPEEEWICLVCISLNSTSSQLSSTANDDPTNHPVQAETSNPTRISKKDIIIAARLWLQENLVEDPESKIAKAEVSLRYTQHVEIKGEGRVAISTLGKYIFKLFPQTTTCRPGARGTTNSAYKGIRWTDASQPPRQNHEDLGFVFSKLKGTVPTLRPVPKGARISVAEALTNILEEVINKNDAESWNKLFTFPYAVLTVPAKSEKVTNLTSWVKMRVSKWKTDPTTTIPTGRQPSPSIHKPQQSQQMISKKVEAKLSDGDIRGAIRLLCSDDTVAPYNQSTIDSLLDKHPPHPEPLNFPVMPDVDEHPAEATEEEILATISSFPPGSAGGLDGLRPQILKDLVGISTGDTGMKLVKTICSFADVVLCGKVPDVVCPTLFGASLTALNKKSGGIRPIAVGNTWRRLVSKIVVTRITPQLVDYFSPHQLGVGIKGGAEIGAHAARRYWSHAHDTAKAFLKLDFRNAFNEIRRDSLLHIIKQRIPSIYSFINQAYAHPSSLFYGNILIPSLLGVQQGDPLGPGLYSLVIQPIIEAVTTEFNVWYLDDATIADIPEKVLHAFDTIRTMGEDVGLHLNYEKCEVGVFGGNPDTHDAIYDEFHKASPGIKIISPEVATLLGAPLTDEAIERVMESKISQLAAFGNRLLQLSAHSAFFLLRASISIPRLIYFLRCAPSWRNHASLLAYDNTLKLVLEGITNCFLSPESWIQSSLPVSKGGLGTRHAVSTAIPCFLASAHSCLPHLESLLPDYIRDQDDAISEGEELWSADYRQLPLPELRGKQAIWEAPLIEHRQKTLLDNTSTPQDKARLLALDRPYVGAWLNAIPAPQLGNHLSNEEFRVAIALRLGCAICQPHKCICGAEVSSSGYHGLSCRKSAGRWSRHSAANDVISRALRTAEVPSIREPVGCCRTDGKRADGMTLIPWSRGKALVWDFTCVDTFAPSYLSSTSGHPGAAAVLAEKKKKTLYSFLEDRFIFIPVAAETIGVWGEDGIKLIQHIGQRITTITGEIRATSYLLQRLSITLQRGNVASILGTLPTGKKLSEIFYL